MSKDIKKEYYSGNQAAKYMAGMEVFLGNMCKYVWRSGKKENESSSKDLGKAADYCEFFIDITLNEEHKKQDSENLRGLPINRSYLILEIAEIQRLYNMGYLAECRKSASTLLTKLKERSK